MKSFFNEITFIFNIETNALFLAVTESNIPMVKLLLTHPNIDVNCKYVLKKGLLFYIISARNFNKVLFLIIFLKFKNNFFIKFLKKFYIISTNNYFE